MEYEGNKAVWQWFIFSLTSASHPKEKGFWSCGCNMSGWREAVWSSLPIAPLGLSSSPPLQLLHLTQGREHARGGTGVQLLHPVTFLCSPPDPACPEPPSSLFVSPPLCFTFAPLLLRSLFSVLPDLAWQRDEWGLALVLCWPGFTATAHRPRSARPYVGLSYPHFYLLMEPCGTGWASIACYSAYCFPINSGSNVFIWVWLYLKIRVKLGSYIFR